MPYVVAVDQGTTGSTVLVFDRLGRVVGRAYSEFTQHYPRPGWVEHDAEEIWQVTLRVLRPAGGRARPQHPRARHHEPARDDGPLEPPHGSPRVSGDRLAGPPHGAALRGAESARPRGPRAPEDGPRPRPLLLRHQAAL